MTHNVIEYPAIMFGTLAAGCTLSTINPASEVGKRTDT